MANHCYWLSATEVAAYIFTDGDCLRSHRNQRLFTRQLQWAMQECKRHLNGERTTAQHRERSADAAPRFIQAVTVRYQAAAEDAEDGASEEVDTEQQQHDESEDDE